MSEQWSGPQTKWPAHQTLWPDHPPDWPGPSTFNQEWSESETESVRQPHHLSDDQQLFYTTSFNCVEWSGGEGGLKPDLLPLSVGANLTHLQMDLSHIEADLSNLQSDLSHLETDLSNGGERAANAGRSKWFSGPQMPVALSPRQTSPCQTVPVMESNYGNADRECRRWCNPAGRPVPESAASFSEWSQPVVMSAECRNSDIEEFDIDDYQNNAIYAIEKNFRHSIKVDDSSDQASSHSRLSGSLLHSPRASLGQPRSSSTSPKEMMVDSACQTGPEGPGLSRLGGPASISHEDRYLMEVNRKKQEELASLLLRDAMDLHSVAASSRAASSWRPLHAEMQDLNEHQKSGRHPQQHPTAGSQFDLEDQMYSASKNDNSDLEAASSNHHRGDSRVEAAPVELKTTSPHLVGNGDMEESQRDMQWVTPGIKKQMNKADSFREHSATPEYFRSTISDKMSDYEDIWEKSPDREKNSPDVSSDGSSFLTPTQSEKLFRAYIKDKLCSNMLSLDPGSDDLSSTFYPPTASSASESAFTTASTLSRSLSLSSMRGCSSSSGNSMSYGQHSKGRSTASPADGQPHQLKGDLTTDCTGTWSCYLDLQQELSSDDEEAISDSESSTDPLEVLELATDTRVMDDAVDIRIYQNIEEHEEADLAVVKEVQRLPSSVASHSSGMTAINPGPGLPSVSSGPGLPDANICPGLPPYNYGPMRHFRYSLSDINRLSRSKSQTPSIRLSLSEVYRAKNSQSSTSSEKLARKYKNESSSSNNSGANTLSSESKSEYSGSSGSSGPPASRPAIVPNRRDSGSKRKQRCRSVSVVRTHSSSASLSQARSTVTRVMKDDITAEHVAEDELIGRSPLFHKHISASLTDISTNLSASSDPKAGSPRPYSHVLEVKRGSGLQVSVQRTQSARFFGGLKKKATLYENRLSTMLGKYVSLSTSSLRSKEDGPVDSSSWEFLGKDNPI